MKIFATILAVLMLTLFAFPVESNATAKASLVASTQSNNTDQPGSHEDNNCPPLCASCNCYSVAELKSPPVAETTLKDLVTRYFSGYINSAPKDISLPVWHPPQL